MLPSVVPRWLLVAALVLLLAGGSAIWLWRSAGSSSPVSEESALESFREGGGAGAGPRPGVPRAGVYTYRQSGEETAGGGAGSAATCGGALRITPAPEGYRGSSLSQQHIEGVRYRVTDGGTRDVAEDRRRSSASGATTAATCARRLRALPRPLAVGSMGRGRTAGDLPVAYHSSPRRRERVEVGDGLPAIVVLVARRRAGGPHPGARTDDLVVAAARCRCADHRVRSAARARSTPAPTCGSRHPLT